MANNRRRVGLLGVLDVLRMLLSMYLLWWLCLWLWLWLRLWLCWCLRCWSRTCAGLASSSSHNLIILPLLEARKLRYLASRIFPIDLDQTRDEELLLLVRLRLPEVRLPQRNEEACVASPFTLVRGNLGVSVRFDMSEVIKIPRLSD